ncbi:YciI family protein [Pseudomonas sp. 1928-m]|uniref:YciI family protein n=1 Tax=Pseudomonas sp. 1928-m TaxID=3033804 RepID=UPI0023DECB40|nr:YciI family protein [Pseudomonas sp. 1928-m]MDF3196046.1 YciI family protein [Pseudomonas sp. 1928-m]
MAQYLVAIHHPDDYDPAIAEDEAMTRDIDVLNDAMVAAGVWVFVGGLHPARCAKSLRAQPNGEVLVSDGPYLQTKEHVGGFWVLETADMDEALAWGRRPPLPAGHRLRCGRFTHKKAPRQGADAVGAGRGWLGQPGGESVRTCLQSAALRPCCVKNRLGKPLAANALQRDPKGE